MHFIIPQIRSCLLIIYIKESYANKSNKNCLEKEELKSPAKKFKDLYLSVRYHEKHRAKDLPETKYSFEVDQVYKFIYENLDDEEAYSEVARIIEPVIKEIIDKEEEGDDESED